MSAVRVVAGFGLRDLRRRWRVMLALGVMVALTVAMVVLLDGYVHSIDVRFRAYQPHLVVQQESTVGEFAGSRIPASVGDELRALGYDPVAEVHTVTGTSGTDATLISGVEPAHYRDLDPYRLLSGRHLRADEATRTTLLGVSLADRFSLTSGDTVRLRGRDFTVVGVFELGTYLDDAAVMPLADAQALLGWGDDVSLYVVGVDGPLVDGDTLPDGLLVAARGDIALVDEWGPLIAMLEASVRLLALGAVAVMAVALWRLAWLHRVDLGVLRLLGFRRRMVAAYLAVQSLILVAVAAGVGVVGAAWVAPHLARTTLAVTTEPVVDSDVVWRAAIVSMTVLAIAVSVSVLAVTRRGVGDLIHRDD